MKWLKMQPSFTMRLSVSADEAMKSIQATIKQAGAEFHAKAVGHCADFAVPPNEARFWSPHLSIQVYESEKGCELIGRFSPRPQIWTAFMFFYLVMVFMMSGAAIFAYVQWFMGHTPWALILIPVGLFTIIGLHAASLIGQSLSEDQMETLRGQLDRAIAVIRKNNDE